MSSFGTRLNTARKGAKMTQIQLAKAAGINQSTISQFEKGKKSPNNFDDIIKIADVLQCDVKWLQTEWLALRERKLSKATKDENLQDIEELLHKLSDENLSLVLKFAKAFSRTH